MDHHRGMLTPSTLYDINVLHTHSGWYFPQENVGLLAKNTMCQWTHIPGARKNKIQKQKQTNKKKIASLFSLYRKVLYFLSSSSRNGSPLLSLSLYTMLCQRFFIFKKVGETEIQCIQCILSIKQKIILLYIPEVFFFLIMVKYT